MRYTGEGDFAVALFLTEEDVRSVLTMDEALSAIETTFHQQGEGLLENVPRRRLRSKDTIFNVMFSANQAEKLMGAKLYTVSGGGARFVVILFESESGRLKAVVEADALGQIRTGAASGVATRHLARTDASRVVIFGAGWQATSQLRAVAAVRRLTRIDVIGRNPERRDAFCETMTQELGVPVVGASDAETATRAAHIIITATTAKEPVLRGAWLSPGTHLNLMGSNHLSRREVDEDVFRRASVTVVDERATAEIESGDMAPAIASGILSWDDVLELGEIVAGRRAGRASDQDITVFESHGIAAEDLSAASRVYTLAKSKGVGREAPFLD